MKKKIFIISGIAVIMCGIVTTLVYFLTKKNDDINVHNLNYVDFSENISESDKIELIKKNIVKIVNTIDKDIQIIGTGFFDSDGYLITNSHIVDIKGNIEIIYYDNSKSKATIFSNDIISDIAILKVNEVKVSALKLDETLNLKIADTLYALGHPLNLEGEPTVTKGILSARRSVAGIEYLQTDASLDNGSSGGPLINTNGGVVGMNSLASNSSNINLALSSETIQNIISKLKSNPNVEYIDNERPQNSLSNVLKEVGYVNTDIYGEWEILNSIYHLHIGINEDSNKNSESNETSNSNSNAKVLDGDSLAKNISISGYDIGFNSYEYSYKFHLLNGEDSLNINVTPNSSLSTYKINGNDNFKPGTNIVSVIITAENGSKTTYTVYVMKPVNSIEGIVGIQCPCSLPTGPSKIFLVCSAVDSSGNNLYSDEYPTHIINTINVEMYVKVAEEGSANKVIDGIPLKYLKTYNFKNSSSTTTSVISVSEIKSLLSEDNYEDNIAKIYFIINATTFKDGSFTTTSTYQLSK